MALLFFSLIFGCEKNLDEVGKAPGIASLAKSGYQEIISYNVGQTTQESIWIAKGGLSDEKGIVELEIYSAAIDSLNLANGTEYELLPEACYNIEKVIEFKQHQDLVESILTYNPGKIVELTGYNSGKYMLPLRLVSKGSLAVFSDKVNLFLNLVVSRPKTTIINSGVFQMDQFDEKISSMDVTVGFGIDLTNIWDIKPKLVHQQEFVDAYNSTNGTHYALLDETCYQVPEEVLISEGTISSTVSYILNKENIMPGGYIFPVQIESIECSLDGTSSEAVIADTETNSVFLFSTMGESISKADWEIASFTTQEPAEAQWGNGGSAIHLIDDNVSTFWHSAWLNGRDPLPYQISIDMKKAHLISQIEILPRGNNTTNPLYILDFETSMDGVNWQFVGRFDFVNQDAALVYEVIPTKAKYIRMTIPDEGENGTVQAFRELSAYGKILE